MARAWRFSAKLRQRRPCRASRGGAISLRLRKLHLQAWHLHLPWSVKWGLLHAGQQTATHLLRVSVASGQGAVEGDREANDKAIGTCSTKVEMRPGHIAHLAMHDGDRPCRAAVCSSSVATSRGVTPLHESTCMPWAAASELSDQAAGLCTGRDCADLQGLWTRCGSCHGYPCPHMTDIDADCALQGLPCKGHCHLTQPDHNLARIWQAAAIPAGLCRGPSAHVSTCMACHGTLEITMFFSVQ